VPGVSRYILGETHRNILARGFATTSDEATQRSGNRFTSAAQLSPPTRKILQPIKKTLYSATRAVICATTLSVFLGLAMAAGVGAPSAAAQDSSSTPTPSDSQSTSQTQTPVAAPGTVAVSKAAAAALAPYTGPKYDNRWEVYGGLLYMNGHAGQNTPVRYNMGGGEAMGTYWLTGKLGVAADYRFGAGTTPVISQFYNRVVVMQNIFSGGVQYRGPKNRYAAIDLHALAGGTDGDFNYAVNHYPGGSPVSACAAQQGTLQNNLGLYCNHIAPYGAVGGSIDFNESGKLAIRLQPDLTFEHFGTETHEYFAISMGVVYRMGKR
jgi:hypothetical protein